MGSSIVSRWLIVRGGPWATNDHSVGSLSPTAIWPIPAVQIVEARTNSWVIPG